jgi:acyl carrier protein
MSTNIDDTVDELIRAALSLRNDEPLDSERPLSALLDSIALVQLLFDIEEACGINFSDDAISDQTFASVGSLRSTVRRLIS